jgi:hypothetical protein
MSGPVGKVALPTSDGVTCHAPGSLHGNFFISSRLMGLQVPLKLTSIVWVRAAHHREAILLCIVPGEQPVRMGVCNWGKSHPAVPLDDQMS